MRREKRNALRARSRFRFGYCGTHEADAGGELTVDHCEPRIHGGSVAPDHLVCACMTCNDFQGRYWHPDSLRRILHPLLDTITDHLRETESGMLEAIAETGRFLVEHLQLSRPQLVARRRRGRDLQSLRENMARLQVEHETLRRYVEAVEEQIRLLLDEADQQTKP